MIIALLTVFTVVAAVIFLGESLSIIKIIGVVLVVIGLLILWAGDTYITNWMNYG